MDAATLMETLIPRKNIIALEKRQKELAASEKLIEKQQRELLAREKIIEIPSTEDLMEMQDVDEQLACLGVVSQLE